MHRCLPQQTDNLMRFESLKEAWWWWRQWWYTLLTNHSTQEAAADRSEFEASLIYRVSSKTRNRALKNKTKQNKKNQALKTPPNKTKFKRERCTHCLLFTGKPTCLFPSQGATQFGRIGLQPLHSEWLVSWAPPLTKMLCFSQITPHSRQPLA